MRINKVLPMTLKLILACIVLISTQVNAGLVNVPGTSVSMMAPDGFSLSQNFNGFENLDTKSSIMIIEFPKKSYAELSELFLDLNQAKKHLAPQGVTILEQQTLPLNTDEQQVLFLGGVQTYEDFEIGKYMALLEGDLTVLVSYNVFNMDTLGIDEVIGSIKTLRLGKEAPIDTQLAQLSFDFTQSGDFKVRDVLGGSSVILSNLDESDSLAPTIVIERANLTSLVTDKVKTAKQLLKGIPGFATASVDLVDYVDFAGTKGIRIEASTQAHRLIQYTGFYEAGAYIRLIATGGEDEISMDQDAINEIADSVKLK